MVKKASREAFWDYNSWGLPKYGVALCIDQDAKIDPQFPLVIDIEDDTKGSIIGIGLKIPKAPFVYYYTPHKFDLVKTLLKARQLIGHVARTDISKLQKNGFDVSDNQLVYDTAIMAHLLDPTKPSYGLKSLAANEGMPYPDYQDIVGEGTLLDVPLDVAANYNSMDVFCTDYLYGKYNVSTQKLSTKRVELAYKLGPALNKMEEKGICIDVPALKEAEKVLEARREALASDLRDELGDINLRSPKQVVGALNAKGLYPMWKRKPSMKTDALKQLPPSQLIDSMLEHSAVNKLITSFTGPLSELGPVIHATFDPSATRTGRFACYQPNLQQVPTKGQYAKLIKDAFVARDGMEFIECDYGQIEPRLLAHFSGCKNLSALFCDGVDFHDFTATRLSIPRPVAKILNLSVGYLATKYSVSRQLSCGLEQAQEHIDAWWRMFPDLRMWLYAYIEKAKAQGYVETLLGLKIPVEGLDEPREFKRSHAERQAINNLCQGSAQEIMQLGMVALYNANYNLLLQVHDSVLLEEAITYLHYAEVSDILCNVHSLHVPLTVSIKHGNRWGDLKKCRTNTQRCL